MSAANVETLRRIYEGWGRGTSAPGSSSTTRTSSSSLRSDFPEAGPHYGLDAIRRYMRGDFLKDFAGATISADEFLDAGDSVVARVDQRATGPSSGAPVSMRYFQVWTFRGGSVIRIESIMERADALEAVGLAE